jgi:hypothetical protein
MHGGRRPKSLEGGNRGGVRADAGVALWGICRRSKTRNGKFVVKRKTHVKRLVRRLKAIREDMLDRMHTPVREQHRWLRQVLR